MEDLRKACVNQNTMTGYEMNNNIFAGDSPYSYTYRSDVTPAMHGVIKFVVVLKTN